MTPGGSTIYCFLLPGSKHLICWRMIVFGRLSVTLLISLLYHYLPYRNSGCINDWYHLFLILLLSESFRLSWNFNLRSSLSLLIRVCLPPNRPCLLLICDWFLSYVDCWLSSLNSVLKSSLCFCVNNLNKTALCLLFYDIGPFLTHVDFFNLDLMDTLPMCAYCSFI